MEGTGDIEPKLNEMVSAVSERMLLRIGGAAAVAGAVVAVIGNALHPRAQASDLGDPAAFLELVSDSPLWVTVHVAVIVATLLFLAGLVAVGRSLADGRGAGLARLGLVSAVVGTVMSLVDVTIDGIVMPRFADSLADRGRAGSEGAIAAAAALYDLNFGLLSVSVVILFFGVTFILYGLAVAISEIYPRWLGWIAAAAGIGSVVVGVVELYEKQSAATFLILFPALAALLSLWMLVMGVFLWRNASGDWTK